MLKRYIGPDPEVSVTIAGYEVGTVKRDEFLAVPADLEGLTAWPETLWDDGPPADKTDDSPEATKLDPVLTVPDDQAANEPASSETNETSTTGEGGEN